MRFFKSCQYEIKSYFYLARKKDKRGFTVITEFINSLVSFTSIILQKLGKNKIISSRKRKFGIFFLNNFQNQSTTIKNIYDFFLQSRTPERFFFGLSMGKKNCVVHYYATEIRDKNNSVMSKVYNTPKLTSNFM